MRSQIVAIIFPLVANSKNRKIIKKSNFHPDEIHAPESFWNCFDAFQDLHAVIDVSECIRNSSKNSQEHTRFHQLIKTEIYFLMIFLFFVIFHRFLVRAD